MVCSARRSALISFVSSSICSSVFRATFERHLFSISLYCRLLLALLQNLSFRAPFRTYSKYVAPNLVDVVALDERVSFGPQQRARLVLQGPSRASCTRHEDEQHQRKVDQSIVLLLDGARRLRRPAKQINAPAVEAPFESSAFIGANGMTSRPSCASR